jgi:hypothetical protein
VSLHRVDVSGVADVSEVRASPPSESAALHISTLRKDPRIESTPEIERSVRQIARNVFLKCTYSVWSTHCGPCSSSLLAVRKEPTDVTSMIFNVRDIMSRSSSVDTATGYELDDRGVGVRFPVGSRMFTSPYCPDGLWCLPNLLSNWVGGGEKRHGREADHWPLTSK